MTAQIQPVQPAQDALATQDLTRQDLMQVLKASLYPGASDSSIALVLNYCAAAKLDVMQKPVHIVPMWDSKAGRTNDVILPGISLYRIQAARSGQLAGISEPEYGPMVRETLSGVEVEYPEWCKVTVRRVLPSGVIAEFSAREFWKENYAVKGGKERSIAPNSMWQRRSRAQIAKCAEAQALRRAFPEMCTSHTAEEMEGRSIGQERDVTPPKATGAIHDPFKPIEQQPEPEPATLELETETAAEYPAWQELYPTGWRAWIENRGMDCTDTKGLLNAWSKDKSNPGLTAHGCNWIWMQLNAIGWAWSDLQDGVSGLPDAIEDCTPEQFYACAKIIKAQLNKEGGK